MTASGFGTQFSTFSVGEQFFGIDVLRVQEVLRYQEMTRIPLAPAVTAGLINLRGQIVTTIDMRRRLGLVERPPEQAPMNMVVRTDEGPVSLLVDEIGDVLQPDGGAFEPPPDSLPQSMRELIHGVYKLKDRLLLVLNSEKVLDVSEFLQSRE
ncbi:MAG TPA: chemotaxis protein CheW [Bryobacteraceae bacterium]|nr:chemotaxis protein CheW [Bryobacteraceae bacterium]